VGDHSTRALCLASLASQLTRQGSLDEALARIRECLAALEELDAPREGIEVLETFGEWLLTSGRAAEAARVLGAADANRTALSMPRLPIERESNARLVERLANELGEAEAKQLRTQGAGLGLAEALAEASAKANGVRQA
jgi:hypothetical protein